MFDRHGLPRLGHRSLVTPHRAVSLALTLCLMCSSTTKAAEPPAEPTSSGSIHDIIRQSEPVAWWDFSSGSDTGWLSWSATDGESSRLLARPGEQRPAEISGAAPEDFPLFPVANPAVEVSTNHYLRVADPGTESLLDFDQGDALTLEAWVSPHRMRSGGFAYVVAKGRTHLPGFSRDSHNYALRLAAKGGSAAISFLFRSRGPQGDWHRWTSDVSFPVNDGWHHVAVTYIFGKPDSLQGYIDGAPVKGRWDMGGKTDQPPVVDDDELWIGSSMGGSPNSTLQGGVDEVAIYRRALTAAEIASRYKFASRELVIDESVVPSDRIRVDVFEGIPDGATWKFRRPRFMETFETEVFGFSNIPRRYNARGVAVDRGDPFLIRAMSRMQFPAGPQRLVIRSRNASRLYIDDQLVAETAFHSIPSSGHGQVVPLDDSLGPHVRPVARGDTQTIFEWTSDGQPHLVRFEMIVGGRKRRPEFGETCVAIADISGDSWQLVSPRRDRKYLLTDSDWSRFVRDQEVELRDANQRQRFLASESERAYWERRHQLAREAIEKSTGPEVPQVDSPAVHNAVDRFIVSQLEAAGEQPTESISDAEFLRRLSLDVLGVIPTLEQVREFAADQRPDRRSRWIDHLLDQPGWADHWVGYWQDVLAENPNIVNPTLNNTGPFRWWIYESFLDNKPFDRFATEMVMMEGSQRYGGPAGFEVATQNDVPMAAKAHIIGQALLGLEMKCARCHDAPFHDFRQRDLFSLAAMLQRAPQGVPESSSIPGGDEVVASLLVEVTLKPGEKVAPQWTFDNLSDQSLPSELLRKPDDTREQLAALITNANNRRFAQVIVNRMWKRYLGHGLVEPVDDWQDASPSHPGLLDYLADELVLSGYDLKHVARLILNSHVYQRRAVGAEQVREGEVFSFTGPVRRRMTAEQLLDSLFTAAGRPMDAGRMCIDIDGARPETVSIDLGIARRAWHFTSLSNERDRPSLALPFAQPYVSLLETFGWRASRQSPVTDRGHEPTVRQPAAVANGLVMRDVVRLTDDSRWTQLVQSSRTPDELVTANFQQILARNPTPAERELFGPLVSEGFTTRLIEPTDSVTRPRLKRGWISWSNHLNPEASIVKAELEAAVRQGPPATERITTDYRERVEDMIWALLNSPEFVFVP